ncbi:hypothetical protein OR60_19010 [Xanthomonas vesicatoria]|uniref:Uncharacterized protein n=1 Tax=Xanthomonas vesicatoria TaxID=56460 RepID=A0AAJ0IZI9_9XANT|nr:hypothetical protein OR60_19010 [Xanthomonas vesicatoria]KHM95929.1 hypothetical protein OR61_07480 [Xanthomonas vesicatoria]
MDAIHIAYPQIAACIAARGIQIRVREEVQLHIAAPQDGVPRVMRMRLALEAKPTIERQRLRDGAAGKDWDGLVVL